MVPFCSRSRIMPSASRSLTLHTGLRSDLWTNERIYVQEMPILELLSSFAAVSKGFHALIPEAWKKITVQDSQILGRRSSLYCFRICGLIGIAIPAWNCGKKMSKNVLVHIPNIFSNSDVVLCESLEGEKNNNTSSKQHQDFKLENSCFAFSEGKKLVHFRPVIKRRVKILIKTVVR